MKKIIFLFLLLAQRAFALDIIWWNTAGAWYIEGAQPKSQVNKENMNKGILKLIESHPDILILGEYYAPAIFPQTIDALNLEYPFSQKMFYSKENHYLEWVIFSKEKVDMEVLENKLGWSDLRSENEWRNRVEAADWDFTRSVIIFKFHGFNIIPIHLAQPWKYLKATQVMSQMISGDSHPIAVQLKKLNSLILNVPTLMVGDFNLPPKILFQTPKAWQNFSHWFRLNNGGQTSFPASGARSLYPSMLLDQAFSNVQNQDNSFDVIKIQGSDHYPIHINWNVK